MADPNAKITISLVDKTKKGFASIGKGMAGVRKAINSTQAAVAGLAGAAGFALLSRSALEAGKEITNLSRVANASAEEFQKLAFGAEMVGVENDKLSDILKDVNDKIGDFAQAGSGPMADFFENIGPKIGVTAKEFKNLSGPQALQKYYDGLEQANLSQAELTFYMEAIASDATALIPLLKENGKGFEEAANQAEKLGLILSDTDVASLDQLGKSLDRVKQVGQGFFNNLLVKFSPVLITIFNDFEDLISQAGGFQKVIDKTFKFAIRAVGLFQDGVRGIQIAFKALQGVANKVLGKITGQIGEFLFALGDLTGNDGLIKASKELKNFAVSAVDTANEVGKSAQKLALEILPSEVISEKVAEYKKAGDAIIAKNVQILASQTGQQGEGISEVVRKKQEEAKSKFAILQGEVKNELALNQAKLSAKLQQDTEFLNNVENRRLLGEENTNTLLQQLREQHGAKMLELEQKAINGLLAQQIDYSNRSALISEQLAERQRTIDQLSAQGKRDLAVGAFREILTIASTNSKKLFELNKKLALADAVINGFKAIQSGFATTPFFPVGIAMGALAAVKTAAQIRNIKATSFSGGGKTPSVTGGSAAIPPTGGATAAAAPNVQGPLEQGRKANINVVGELDSREKVLNFAQQLVELRDDGFTEFDVLLGDPA